MRRFYSSSELIVGSMVDLDLEQSRHLRNVLRLQNGDEVAVFNGLGDEFLCSVQEKGTGKEQTTLQIIKKIGSTAPESKLKLTIAVSLLKSDKFDLVIQKSVELGVANLIPLVTKRCDVKLTNIQSKSARFERIVIESSKQCGRAKLMQISDPLEFEEFVRLAEGVNILFSERGGKNFSELKPDSKLTAAIGPEGGWEDSEIDLATQNDFKIITLGGRILRAETAAISIVSVLQHNFGDLN